MTTTINIVTAAFEKVNDILGHVNDILGLISCPMYI